MIPKPINPILVSIFFNSRTDKTQGRRDAEEAMTTSLTERSLVAQTIHLSSAVV